MRNISYKTLITKLFTIINLVSLLLGSFVSVVYAQRKAPARTGVAAQSGQMAQDFNLPVNEIAGNYSWSLARPVALPPVAE